MALPQRGFAGARGFEIDGPYRADVLRPIGSGRPADVDLLIASGQSWPAAARRALADRILREWPSDQRYGPVQSGVGVWLEYPMVTARIGGRVVVPVTDRAVLPIRGRLQLPPDSGRPKRVVLLIDASSSANQKTPFESPDGSVEYISVLDAELRAVEHLLGLLGDDWLEFGIIAFGEGTWPIAEIGASSAQLRERLAEFRRVHPRGQGRTDTICALWTAVDWLDSTPDGVGREIVLLTDGDMPHSGRFTNCLQGSKAGRSACEARRNTTVCPASKKLATRGGRSDLIQLARLGRNLRKRVRVSPVVFEPDRRARPYRALARDTRGSFVQVPSVQGIEVALPPLVAGRIRGVFARNLRTGETTDDLLTDDVSSFAGGLGLAPGANDIELRVASDRGQASLFRFRVYSEPGYLARYLAGLRERNRTLELRAESLVDETRQLQRRERGLEISVEPAIPAAADD